jgi:hypothetical protein
MPYTYMRLAAFHLRVGWGGRLLRCNKGGGPVSHLTVNRIRWGVALAIALVLPLQSLRAEEPAASVRPEKNKEHFLRIERDPAGHELALQTAIIRFESDAPERKGFVVDLIGAVHVGEKAYYQALNKQFEDYDAVLYELVAPEGTRVPKGSKPGGHPVSYLQNGMKDLLGLEHQLQYIDYSRANLVHADMSPDDFAKSMEDRGESIGTMLLRLMAASMARQASEASQAKSSDLDLVMALFDRNRGLRLKRLVAEQFADLETVMAALNGPDGSTIVTERNKVALGKLEKQWSQGRKRLAIFYGVGHLPDMAQRLAADFKLHETGQHWLTAWNLAENPVAAGAAQTAEPADAAK